MKESLLRRTVSVFIAAALAWSPALPAAAQFRAAATPVRPTAPMTAAPAVLPVSSLGLSAPTLSAPNLAAPGLASPFSAVSPVPQVRSANPSAATAMSPAVALPSSILSAPAVAPAAANPKAQDPRAAAAKQVGAMTFAVSAAVKTAGPVANGTSENAQGLGAAVFSALTGGRSSSRGQAEPIPVSRVFSGIRRSALNGVTERPAAPQPSPEATRTAMLRTLEFVASVFNAHYAPLDWKRETFGTELAAEVEKARLAIRSMQTPTTREFQDILARLVGSLKDYHVGIQFYSTEMSRLPLGIVGAGGKHYLATVDREELPEELFPFAPGDEVVAFDGRPTAEVVAELLQVKSEGGAEATDRSLAERRLTRRVRQAGDTAPQGPVTLTIRAADGREAEVGMEWSHVPELIPQIPIRDGGGLLEPTNPDQPTRPADVGTEPVDAGWASSLRAALMKLIPSGLNPLAALLGRRAPGERLNPYQIGGRESFVPQLGTVVWQGDPRLPYKAYIYKTADGRKVGYIRIAAYDGDARVAAVFGAIMKKFEAETDSLVIDQVNNPGGSLFYMYALLSRLSAKPLSLPTQKIVIGEDDAYESIQTLMAAQQVTSEEQLSQILGPSLDGYRVTMRLWRSMVAYAQFIYSQLRAGQRLSDLVAFLGIEKLEQHPTERYTKPIMVLVNELDFSCGDFFPAILQDNGRAAIFGVRTAGAGGAVKGVQFPNQFGIAGLSYTWTIALRAGGMPIENLGVTPDVAYTPTAADLKDGYSGYRDAVNAALGGLMGPAGPASADPGPSAPTPTTDSGPAQP
ncbi:MAG: protease-like activity factor CPAF [Elusimicrobia bacterium]|nr:protease-like activity factor CPAF [Elusimicrobiota bacterium]